MKGRIAPYPCCLVGGAHEGKNSLHETTSELGAKNFLPTISIRSKPATHHILYAKASRWHGEMYVTKRLSDCYRSPGALSEPPPQGPGSGVLVIEDEEAKVEVTCCWGLCRNSELYNLPFPQNRKLQVRYSTGDGEDRDDVFFVPVIGQPLSSNRYYVIIADGRHKGNACTCSKEEDQKTCCLCTFTNDVRPSPFDHRDIYQQLEFTCHNNTFQAKAVASDGIPPMFLRRINGSNIYTSTRNNYHLDEALGLDMSLRAQMPDLNFPISAKQSSAMVVGKWYCPFMFVKEGDRVKDQMKRSMFYEMTLQQFWEEIYSCENYSGEGKAVEVSTGVKRDMALPNGSEVVHINMQVTDGYIWFKPVNSVENGLGLNQIVWERMRWEESRGGWMGGEEVGRVEEMFEGHDGWKKFGCYVLVERFILKRMDGSLALSYDFRHTNKIRTKWE